MPNKTCTKCRKVKDLSCYHKDKKSADGHSWVCKTCIKEKSAAYYAKDPERKKWRGIKSTYGLTQQNYEALAAQQQYKCPITHLPFSECDIVIDHNHDLQKGEIGYVRGLIEDNVNKALGLFKDHPEWLRRAADYLEMKGGQE